VGKRKIPTMKMSRVQRLVVNRLGNPQKLELVESMLDKAGAQRSGTVLEVGCGAGFVAFNLHERHGMSVTGVDVDAEQIKAARDSYGSSETLRFLESDTASLPFKDGEFDLVIVQMVLHHVPEWQAALGELARVLKQGRFLVFDDAVYTDVTRKYLKALIKGHSFYSEEEVIETLRDRDLSVVHQEEKWGVMKFLVRHCILLFQKSGEVY
jgi:ubiquinone/menaquinone biosynthesis C-methylase UbiE